MGCVYVHCYICRQEEGGVHQRICILFSEHSLGYDFRWSQFWKPLLESSTMELGRIYDCEINGNMTLKLDLIGGLEPWNFMTVHSVGNFVVPTDFHSIIFQRGRLKPPTRYIHRYIYIVYIVCIINEYIYTYIYISVRLLQLSFPFLWWRVPQLVPIYPSYPIIIPLLSLYYPIIIQLFSILNHIKLY